MEESMQLEAPTVADLEAPIVQSMQLEAPTVADLEAPMVQSMHLEAPTVVVQVQSMPLELTRRDEFMQFDASTIADFEAPTVVVQVQSMPLELTRRDEFMQFDASTIADLEAPTVVVQVQSMPLELTRRDEFMQFDASTIADLEASPQRELSEDIEDVGDQPPLSLESMKKKINRGKTNEANNFTIFRTPHNISQSKENLFEPSVISIGPFHRGKKSLKAMEEQKWRFLRDFLSRKDHISFDLCITEMKLLETRTRRCYSETFDDLHSDTFVGMMLLDGCFVVEYFSKKMENNWQSILEVGWNRHFIKRDLLLLENQIPFFIVEKLYELIGFNQEQKMIFVEYLASNLFPSILPGPPDSIDSKIPHPPDEIHHLVHLCYLYLVPKPEKPVVLSSKSFDHTTEFQTSCIKFSMLVALPNSTRNLSSMVIRSATELKLKGVKFTPKSNPKHMLDISFENGVLKIPTLKITDDTKPIFANLIALEHSKFGKENSPFGRFVQFLDNLVNTQNDVTILQECGIIENWLGSEAELANFINQVTEGNCIGEDHYLKDLYKEVNRYIESSWHRHRAKLIRDYFSSPWSAISLVAALILLVLTCVQSFYAVYAYKFPPSS